MRDTVWAHDLSGEVLGAVTTVTTTTNLTTNNDKTGYALTAGERTSIGSAVWADAKAGSVADSMRLRQLRMDSLMTANLDEAISGIDDDPWDNSPRSLTVLDDDGGTTVDLSHSTIGTATNLTTNNDKTGYALTAGERTSIGTAVWADAKAGSVADSVDSCAARSRRADSLAVLYLDEAISGIDDNAWDDGTRTLTELDEDNTIIDLDGITIDSVRSVGTVASVTAVVGSVAISDLDKSEMRDTVWAHDLSGEVMGSVTTVTTTTNLTTNNDKNGYGLTPTERTASAAAVWSHANATSAEDLDSCTSRTQIMVGWADSIAYLDKSIIGIDDDPWDAGSRTLTELDEDNTTIDLDGITIDSVRAVGTTTTVTTVTTLAGSVAVFDADKDSLARVVGDSIEADSVYVKAAALAAMADSVVAEDYIKVIGLSVFGHRFLDYTGLGGEVGTLRFVYGTDTLEQVFYYSVADTTVDSIKTISGGP
jgi:hypothetical protein